MNKRKIFASICALLFIPFASVNADDSLDLKTIDRTRTGNLTISYIDGDTGSGVGGAEFKVYKIGEIESNGDVKSLIDSEISNEVNPADLEAKVSNDLVTYTCTTDDRGSAVVSGMDLGVYLAVETKAADGYEKSSSFIFETPYTVDGTKWEYNVLAEPKAIKIPEEEAKTGLDGSDTGICTIGIGIGLACLAGVLVLYKRQEA